MTEVFQYTESGYTFIDTATVLTPDQTELFLKLLHNELGKAQLAVKQTRDAELDAGVHEGAASAAGRGGLSRPGA
jgi:hypothetical protein